MPSKTQNPCLFFVIVYLQKGGGILLLEHLDRELQQSGGFLQLPRTVRDLLLVYPRFVLALLLNVLE